MSMEHSESQAPFPVMQRADLDKIIVYGVWKTMPEKWYYGMAREDELAILTDLQHHVFAYGFAFQGHCYRLSIPAEYRFEYYCEEELIVATAEPGYGGGRDITGRTKLRATGTKMRLPRGPEPAVGCGYESLHERRVLRSQGPSAPPPNNDPNAPVIKPGPGVPPSPVVATEVVPGYYMWFIDQTTPIQRIERRQGSASDLILDFNLPGRSPATLTYSAKVGIASRSGKAIE